MLAVILYTNFNSVAVDLLAAERIGDFMKWPTLSALLNSAVARLGEANPHSSDTAIIFTGIPFDLIYRRSSDILLPTFISANKDIKFARSICVALLAFITLH